MPQLIIVKRHQFATIGLNAIIRFLVKEFPNIVLYIIRSGIERDNTLFFIY